MAETSVPLNCRIPKSLKEEIDRICKEASKPDNEVSITEAVVLLLKRGVAEARADGLLIESAVFHVVSDEGKALAALKDSAKNPSNTIKLNEAPARRRAS